MATLRIRKNLLSDLYVLTVSLLFVDKKALASEGKSIEDLFEKKVISQEHAQILAKLAEFTPTLPETNAEKAEFQEIMSDVTSSFASSDLLPVNESIKIFSGHLARLCHQPENDIYTTLKQSYVCLSQLEAPYHVINAETVKTFKQMYGSGALGYTGKDFDNVDVMFGVPNEANTIVDCCLVPKLLANSPDGRTDNGTCYLFYGLIQDEKEAQAGNYLNQNNSLLLKRKTSTPFHEGIHYLLDVSPLKNKLLYMMGITQLPAENLEGCCNKDDFPQMKQFMEKFLTCIENNQNLCHYRGMPKDNSSSVNLAYRIISEAFAVSGSMYVTENLGGKLPSQEKDWYSGWFFAGKLSKHVYPIFKEYLKEGKPIDDTFFARLNGDKKLMAYLASPHGEPIIRPTKGKDK